MILVLFKILQVVRKREGNSRIFDKIVVLKSLLKLWVLSLWILLVDKSSGEVGVEDDFIVGDFSELLHQLDKVIIFDMDSTWVGNKDKSGVKLPNLIEKKISNNEPYEVALVVFNVFLIF